MTKLKGADPLIQRSGPLQPQHKLQKIQNHERIN